MKINTKWLLLLLLVLVTQLSYAQINQDSLKALTDQYLKINPEASGVIAAVDIPGKTRWKYSAGHLGISKEKKINGEEQFIAASITKTFIAACILLQEEEGLLSLKDKVIDYLEPAVIRELTTYRGKSYEKELTIEHLLRHTSGIFDYLNEGQVHLEAYKNYPDKTYSLEDRIAIALEVGSANNRIGKYHYSNTNYILLGMITEKIDGSTIADILDTRVIKPLGLKNTSLNPDKDRLPKMLKGYYTNWDLTSFTLNFNKQNSAGGILTTVDDLILFGKGIFTGRLFKSKNTLAKMLDFKKGYGLGVMQFERTAKTGGVIGHSGFDPGYTCYLAYLEKPNITVVTVINQSELRVVMPAYLIVKTVHLIKEGL